MGINDVFAKIVTIIFNMCSRFDEILMNCLQRNFQARSPQYLLNREKVNLWALLTKSNDPLMLQAIEDLYKHKLLLRLGRFESDEDRCHEVICRLNLKFIKMEDCLCWK